MKIKRLILRGMKSRKNKVVALILLIMSLQIWYAFYIIPDLGNGTRFSFLMTFLPMEIVFAIGVYFEKSWAEILVSIGALGYFISAVLGIYDGFEGKTHLESMSNLLFSVSAGLVGLVIFILIFKIRYTRSQKLTADLMKT